MNESRLIIKLNDGEICKVCEYGGVKEFKERYKVCDADLNIVGYRVHVGFVHLTNNPVILISSDKKDVNVLTNEDIFNIWAVAISLLMFWCAKGKPYEDYHNIMKEHFGLMDKFTNKCSDLLPLYKLYGKLDKAKKRPSYSKIKRRYVNLMRNVYILHYKLASMKILGLM